MSIVNSGIEYRYDDLRAACVDLPSLRAIDICVWRSSLTYFMVEPPLQGKISIVGHNVNMTYEIQLGIFNPWS